MRMDFVRTEVGKGGPTMIRCGFIAAYFPELILPPRARHLSERSDWQPGGGRDDIMWFGPLRP